MEPTPTPEARAAGRCSTSRRSGIGSLRRRSSSNTAPISTRRDSDGATPLHLAACYSDERLIGLLLDRGADIDVRDNYGWTSLHGAAFIGRVDEVTFLVSRGADVLIRENHGRTPLDVALENKYVEDLWPTLERLLGGKRVSVEARLSSLSPSEIVRDSRRLPGSERDDGNDRGPHDRGR